MKYAICNEMFVDWPFPKAFSFARECGYTGIEFAPFTMGDDAHSISPEVRSTTRQQASDAGLEVVGLHWLLAKTDGYYLTSPQASIRRDTASYLGALAALCRDLGGHIMVLGSPHQRNLLPGVNYERALDYAADVIRQAVPAFEDCDVTLAVEPLGPEEGDFLLTAAAGIELVQLVESDRVRLHLDVKAMSTEERPVPWIIRESSDYTVHFHANDPNRRGPGMGKVDFVPIFQTLDEIGYDGWVSVEVFDYEPGAEFLARESIHYMMACQEKFR